MKKYCFFALCLIFVNCKRDVTNQGNTVKEKIPEPIFTILDNATIDKVDIAILNGHIIDGTGKPAYKANIYLNKDSIIFIGTLSNPNLQIGKTIDAHNRYISPGFIDPHSHGDPLSTPNFENFLAMGVTTISLGKDGSSPAYKDLKGYIDKVNDLNLGVNIVQFTGHGTLRNLAGIGLKEKVSLREMELMKNLLRSQLKYCHGLSTGLEYAPGLFAQEEELLALAEVVGEEGKIITSHMRNEDNDQLLASITELAKQGQYANVHISHLKAVYGKGKERAKEILDSIYQLRKTGIEITAEVYPYEASYTGISILFPDWSKTSSQFLKAKKTRRTELATFIRNKVNKRNGPEATLIGTGAYKGMTLAEVARSKNKPFEDVLIDDIGAQGASAAYFVMDKSLQEALIMDPLVSICSDGSKTSTHPRGHGTFAKVIENYVVKDSLLSLEEAIRKMTSYPAQILKLKNRGRLAPGLKADILIFDPLKVKATATFNDPFQLALGFDKVIMSGVMVRQDGVLAKKLKGQVLNPNGKN